MGQGKFTFLGTGASTGVPVIGCTCPVCSSGKVKRLRSSALVEVEEKKFLIDVGPDFREQALKHRITHLHAVFLTHTHYDHLAGIDELRAFRFFNEEKVHVILSKESLDELKRRYYYLFEGKMHTYEFDALKSDFGVLSVKDVSIGFVSYFQKEMKVNGYRFGNLAYLSDIRDYEEKIFDYLEGVDILILSALRHTANPAHFSLEEAYEFGKKVGASQVILTHLGHEIEPEVKLADNMLLAKDGMEVLFTL